MRITKDVVDALYCKYRAGTLKSNSLEMYQSTSFINSDDVTSFFSSYHESLSEHIKILGLGDNKGKSTSPLEAIKSNLLKKLDEEE